MKKSSLLILFSNILVLIVMTTGIVLAWLEHQKEGNTILNVQPYQDFAFITSFKNGAEIVKENNLLVLNGNSKTESSDDSLAYIEDLEVSITFIPTVPTYLRVEIFDSWKLRREYSSGRVTEQIVPVMVVDSEGNEINHYEFAEGWYFDKKTGYVYYQNLIPKSNDPVMIPFITNGNGMQANTSTRFSDTYTVYLNLSGGIVQANRYQEIWGIATIPSKPEGGEENA